MGLGASIASSSVAKLGCGGRVTCHGQDFTIAAARAVNRAKKGEADEEVPEADLITYGESDEEVPEADLSNATHILCDPSCSNGFNFLPRFSDDEVAEAGPSNATHILCDPSSSGSGLVAQYHGVAGGVQTGEEGVVEYGSGLVAQYHGVAGGVQTGEEGVSEYDIGGSDLAALAAEQAKIVLAAMALPKAQVVVYSTCSIHREENEDVVATVSLNPYGFKLVKTLPDWPHRGLQSAGAIGEMCVRASHDKDDTNGFFVARFETLTPIQIKSN
ncbi:hypothetical protein T484DRAFT_1769047 [Baffinella frigidus]|nr:hypothetical protein T484DRAFT_1769047 [Cryptophyta sp. CCMP2293]